MQIDLGEFADLILKSVPRREGRPSRYMNVKRFVLTSEYINRMHGRVLNDSDRQEWKTWVLPDSEFIESVALSNGDVWLVMENPEWPLLRNPSIVDIPVEHTFQ